MSLQHTVHTQAHAEDFHLRVEMDIRGIKGHGFGEYVVDQLDHRRFFRHFAQAFGLAALGKKTLGGEFFA
jgi:hypothetical protein